MIVNMKLSCEFLYPGFNVIQTYSWNIVILLCLEHFKYFID